jgi:hypothetical protein
MDFNEIFNPNKPKLVAIIAVLFVLFLYFYTQVKIQTNCAAKDEACKSGAAFLSVQGAFFITLIAGIPVSLLVFLLVGFLLGAMNR